MKKKDFAAAIADEPAEEHAVIEAPVENKQQKKRQNNFGECAGGEMADALP